MADLNLRAGQTVQTQDGRQGVIRYMGQLHIAAGEWLGLELPDNTGKNDGSVKGERYFQCQPGYGIFVRKESLAKIVKQAVTAQRANGASTPQNGSAVRPRPSSGVTPVEAKKRQSLMSMASRGTAGSRLSTIVRLPRTEMDAN
jgi:dynactin 1